MRGGRGCRLAAAALGTAIVLGVAAAGSGHGDDVAGLARLRGLHHFAQQNAQGGGTRDHPARLLQNSHPRRVAEEGAEHARGGPAPRAAAPEARERHPWLSGAFFSLLEVVAVAVFLRYKQISEPGSPEDGPAPPPPRPPPKPDARSREQPEVRQRGAARAEPAMRAESAGPYDGCIEELVGPDDSKRREARSCAQAGALSYALALLVLIISYAAAPTDWKPARPTTHHVFYYGWLTDVATALGALPFLCFPSVGGKTVGVANAIAAGMMISASVQLFSEGAENRDAADGSNALFRVLVGCAFGALFIVITEKALEQHEDIKVAHLTGLSARKVLLIMTVMTLHSFAEGVGVGVSFGGPRGSSLGFCISMCLAIHNIPEGLAVSMVLVTRGVSVLNAALWCVFTSLPQPLMAVPAFEAVAWFLPLLPLGLGFAAGAMLWVAFAELVTEAAEAVGAAKTTAASGVAFALSYALQAWVTD